MPQIKHQLFPKGSTAMFLKVELAAYNTPHPVHLHLFSTRTKVLSDRCMIIRGSGT